MLKWVCTPRMWTETTGVSEALIMFSLTSRKKWNCTNISFTWTDMGTLYSVHQMLILSPSEQWVSWGEGGSLLCSLKDSPSFSRVGCDWQFIWSRLRGFAVWIITNCGKFLKKWECQTTLPASWGICMQVKKQQLEVDMDKGLVPNWERRTSRLFCCHSAYLT